MLQSVTAITAFLAAVGVLSFIHYGDARAIPDHTYRGVPTGVQERGEFASTSDESEGPDENKINEDLGVNLFEGDIDLTPEQKKLIEELDREEERSDITKQAFMSPVHRWTNGIVPYTMDNNLKKKTRNIILEAMNELQRASGNCVQFKERTNEKNYVHILSKDGCHSELGMVGGVQELSIENTVTTYPEPGIVEETGCASKGIVMHEMLHGLGRFHEQNRPDRDKYVKVHLNRIKKGYEVNYKRQPASVADTQGLPYDFDSLMHYGASDFAIDPNKPIMISLTGEKITGQRTHLSKVDIQHLVKAYCPKTQPKPAPKPSPTPEPDYYYHYYY